MSVKVRVCQFCRHQPHCRTLPRPPRHQPPRTRPPTVWRQELSVIYRFAAINRIAAPCPEQPTLCKNYTIKPILTVLQSFLIKKSNYDLFFNKEVLLYITVYNVDGELVEWSKAPHWKCGVPQGTEGSNPSLSAIFVLKQTDKNHGIKQRAKLQASLAICSFFFMPGTLMRKISARACDFLGGCLPLLAVNGSAAQARGT